jgi:hypothetical protein
MLSHFKTRFESGLQNEATARLKSCVTQGVLKALSHEANCRKKNLDGAIV